VGCSSSGTFTIDRFSDQYCLEYYDTYDRLSSFNSLMHKLKCFNCHDSNQGQDVSYSVASYLIKDSSSCSEAESSLCTTSKFVANSGSNTSGNQRTSSRYGSSGSSFGNRVKYTLGSAMLIGSIVMFFGILFTNRKKRSMKKRKFRSGSEKKKRSSSSRKSSKSSSKKSNSGVFA